MHSTARTKNHHTNLTVHQNPIILLKILIYIKLKYMTICHHFVTKPPTTRLRCVCEGFIHRVIHRFCEYSANMKQHNGLAVMCNKPLKYVP